MSNYSVTVGTIPTFRSRSSSGFPLLNAVSDSGTMVNEFRSSGSQSIFTTLNMSPTKGLIKEEEPELAGMTDAEIRELALSAAGMWADRDDIDIDWLDDLRSSWHDRLDELYNDPPTSI